MPGRHVSGGLHSTHGHSHLEDMSYTLSLSLGFLQLFNGDKNWTGGIRSSQSLRQKFWLLEVYAARNAV